MCVFPTGSDDVILACVRNVIDTINEVRISLLQENVVCISLRSMCVCWFSLSLGSGQPIPFFCMAIATDTDGWVFVVVFFLLPSINISEVSENEEIEFNGAKISHFLL